MYTFDWRELSQADIVIYTSQYHAHTVQSQNSISLDQAHEISGFLAKYLDTMILHGERAACANIADTVSLSTVIQ